MGVETGTLSQLLLKISLQISAGRCWSQSRMKVLLLAAALVSQVVGRPQQGEHQPGNGWGNTRPAQPTQWSAWSSGGGAAPTSYNSYDSYNSYNPYNPYNSYVPGGARPSPCGTGRCPSPWGGACATACPSPCSQPQPGPGPMPQPLPFPMPAPMPQPLPMPMPQPAPMPMLVPMPQPMQPGNCGSGGCGQMPQPSRCQLGSGPQMGPLLGPIATTGCGASDRDMPTYGAPSNGWMPGNSWMTKPWPQQPAPMPMPMPEPMPSGNCGPGGCGQEREDCNSCGK